MSRLLVVFLIGILVSLIFSMQNNFSITLYFGPWEVQGPISLVLLISFSIGFFLSLIAVLPTLIRNRRIISVQSKKIQELEKKITSESSEKEIKNL
jgi:uncharacterized integral membrane protein